MGTDIYHKFNRLFIFQKCGLNSFSRAQHMKHLTWSEGLNSRQTNWWKVNFGSNFECWKGFYYKI